MRATPRDWLGAGLLTLVLVVLVVLLVAAALPAADEARAAVRALLGA